MADQLIPHGNHIGIPDADFDGRTDAKQHLCTMRIDKLTLHRPRVTISAAALVKFRVSDLPPSMRLSAGN